MNYLCDYHMHSTFSFDAVQTIEEAVKSAINNKINEICFTEHVSFDPDDSSYKTFKFEDYFKQIKKIQDLYKKQITIKAGIEAGEYYLYKDDFDLYFKENNIDFVIGSVHNINKKGLRTNLRENGHSISYENYFNEVLKLASCGDFDVLGHLDLIQRYAFNDFGVYDFNKYTEIIHEILKTVIRRNKGIEINTSGYMSNNLFFPRLEIIKLYKELGGKILTVGSDAHDSKRVGENIQYTYELLKNIGFECIYTFEKRTPKAIVL